MTSAPGEDSDQPGHPSRLIRVFAVRSMGSYRPKLSSCSCGQQRLIRLSGCIGWSEFSLGARRFVGFVVLGLIYTDWSGGRYHVEWMSWYHHITRDANVVCDQMISAHPRDVIPSARSSSYCNNIYCIKTPHKPKACILFQWNIETYKLDRKINLGKFTKSKRFNCPTVIMFLLYAFSVCFLHHFTHFTPKTHEHLTLRFESWRHRIGSIVLKDVW